MHRSVSFVNQQRSFIFVSFVVLSGWCWFESKVCYLLSYFYAVLYVLFFSPFPLWGLKTYIESTLTWLVLAALSWTEPAALCPLSSRLCSYQYALILLIYLLPLLVMLVTYSLVGQTLWGARIPGEASDHYHGQITAKRKVTNYFPKYVFTYMDVKPKWSDVRWRWINLMSHRWWRWWLLWWWPLPSAGYPTTSTSY